MVRQRGDTIIEVMFAVAVFAMVAVGSLTIMNQGVATAQRSLEVTLVRQQIQAQAEALRFDHDAYVASYQPGVAPAAGTPADQWVQLRAKAAGVTKPSDFSAAVGANGMVCVNPGAQNPFFMNARKATIAPTTVNWGSPSDSSLPPFAQVMYDSSGNVTNAYGLWIEAVPGQDPNSNTQFIDFHIRACWNTVGTDRPATLGTIVRLYEPAS